MDLWGTNKQTNKKIGGLGGKLSQARNRLSIPRDIVSLYYCILLVEDYYLVMTCIMLSTYLHPLHSLE